MTHKRVFQDDPTQPEGLGADVDGPEGRRSKRRRLAVEALSDFLEKHKALVRSSGSRVEQWEYHNSFRVCYDWDRERGLFRKYDPVVGRDVYTWQRCQYALSRKVKLEQHHERPDCDGWSKEKGVGVTGPLLARCGCPFVLQEKKWVWLVDPKELQVEVKTEDGARRIRHGELAGVEANVL